MKKHSKTSLIVITLIFVLCSCGNNTVIDSSNSGTSISENNSATTIDESTLTDSGSISSSTSENITTSSSSSTNIISFVDENNYYAKASGTGLTLFNNLRSIINSGFKTLGYNGLDDAYPITDVRDDGHINDYYSNVTNWDIDDLNNGNYKKEGDLFNKEHSIPKSWWGGSKSNQGCDVYIVVPTDGYVNNRRSNFCFGEVDKNNIKYASANNYCLLGKSKISSYQGTENVFEPNDEWKGDFARIYFYALTKWKNSENWTGGNGKYFFSGSLNTNMGLTNYAVNLLLSWNKLDPVSEYERKKNDAAYTLQGNRNPYVDHPEYVEEIWHTV